MSLAWRVMLAAEVSGGLPKAMLVVINKTTQIRALLRMRAKAMLVVINKTTRTRVLLRMRATRTRSR